MELKDVMNKKKLVNLYNELYDWLNDFDDENKSEETEAIFQEVRNQLEELEDYINTL